MTDEKSAALGRYMQACEELYAAAKEDPEIMEMFRPRPDIFAGLIQTLPEEHGIVYYKKEEK